MGVVPPPYNKYVIYLLYAKSYSMEHKIFVKLHLKKVDKDKKLFFKYLLYTHF